MSRFNRGNRNIILLTSPQFESFKDFFNLSEDMSNSQRLAFAIIEHLSSQLKSGAITGDSAESLEGKCQNIIKLYRNSKKNN